MTESELLPKIRSGDENAFVELYNRWQNSILRFAYQMTGSKSMAEDITQEVFLLLIRKNLNFDPEKGSFSSFLYGIARNLSLRMLRKNFRYQDILQVFRISKSPISEDDPFANFSDRQISAALRRCILSLPRRYREVVVLCDLHELSYVEVASAIQTEVGTVRSRLHRGREMLAQKLRAMGELRREGKGGTPYELPALQK